MVMVIAEAGVNHQGDPRLAHELVEAAKSAGADAVKFQIFDPEKLDPPGARREMLKGLALRPLEFTRLKQHCDSIGIEFIATPFDVDNLQFLVALGVNYIKIGSADWRNILLVGSAMNSGKRVIMSTGMANISEIQDMWLNTFPYAFLHCTSAYPTPIEDVNLKAMRALGKEMNIPVGLSDHTSSLVIPAAAVAMGAEVIEKHLTLDNRMEGPDHRASLEPRDFAEMVANIREVELALGDGIKRPMPSEEAVMKVRREREEWRCAS